MNAAVYCRVSTDEQALEGLSLEAQRGACLAELERREWKPATIITEQGSGRTVRRRPLFDRLLSQLDAGTYDALIVSRLDRISRSLADFCGVLDRASGHGWVVVMLDPQVDTSTPYGRAMAQMGGVFAELESALIGQRTREGLAVARRRGTFRPGEHLRYTDPTVIARIVRWASQDVSFREIARRLEAEGVAGPGGDAWHPRTIGRIYARAITGATEEHSR